MTAPTAHPRIRFSLLPLLAAVTFFFVTQGIGLPALGESSAAQPGLSRVTKCVEVAAVCKSLSSKPAQVKSAKSSTACAVPAGSSRPIPPAVLASCLASFEGSYLSAAVSAFPARAPPA